MNTHQQKIITALDDLGAQIRRMEQRMPAVRYELGELWGKDRVAREAVSAMTAELEAIGAGGVEQLRKSGCLVQIDEPCQHMQELRAYEVTVARRDAQIAQLEAQLAAVPQGVHPTDAELQAEAGWLSASNPQSNGIDREVQLMRNALHKWGVVATHPTQQGRDALTKAASSVLAERARQIAAEGYTPEQDDGYNPGVLALHGGLYACHAYDNLTKKRAPEGWQWDEKWWKPKDPRSNLVKAGALVLAEIERIDRVCAAQAKQGEQAND